MPMEFRNCCKWVSELSNGPERSPTSVVSTVGRHPDHVDGGARWVVSEAGRQG
jgi:hypothetical protein